MNFSLLFWIYLINAVLLINHEIDSAYWREWNLYDSKNVTKGIKGFLIIHFPLVFLVLFGLVLIDRALVVGFIISLVIAGSGIFAFFFHYYHLRKGRNEFSNWISKMILNVILPISLLQIILTIEKLT